MNKSKIITTNRGGYPHGLIVIIITIISVFQNFTTTVTAVTPFASSQIYEGLENGPTLLNNIRFNDISNHWAREPIQEVAAFSIMKGENNKLFRPNGTLTYAEALTTLVRAIGKEGEAQMLAEQQLPPKIRDFVFLTVVEDWAKGYIQVAMQEGILTQEEENQILNLTPRQLADIEYQVSEQLKDYKGENYTAGELTQIQNQVRDKLLHSSTWNKPVTRQQIAVWVARALEIEPSYGENIVKANNFIDWRQIDTEKLPLIETLLQKGYMQGMSSTTFAPKGTLTRGQLAQLIANINDEFLDKRSIIKKTGTIHKIETIEHQGANEKIFTVENDDNSKSIITVAPLQDNDFILQRGKTLTLSAPLKEGDRLDYYININGQVFYAKENSDSIRTTEGIINHIDMENYSLIIMDSNDKKYFLQTEPFTIIEIDGENASFKDLFNGQEVSVSLVGKQIKKIEGFLDIDPSQHGYIQPGSRTRVGKVLYIDKDTVEIIIRDRTEKYKITPYTEVLKSGGKASLFEIKEGDRVLLAFDDIYTTEIASIQVEDNEKHITALYRGTLDYINDKGREIILDNISTYQNGKWNKNGHSNQKIKLKVEEQALYSGGNLIDLKDLEVHRGREIYVAVENSYGVEKVVKLLLKEGSLITYKDKITGIQYGSSQMVVDNNIFTFHPGTIVVKNNRLVDALNLEQDQNVYLAGSIANGTRNAAIIDIQYDGMLDDRIDGTRLSIYRGKLEDIRDYGITVGRLSYYLDYLKLDNNSWSTISRAKDLILTEDSYIFDSDIKKEIDVGHLINSRYINPNDINDPVLRNRIKNNFYTGKSAYVVVKETTIGNQVFEEVLLLNFTPNIPVYGGMVNIDHSAIGEVEIVNLDTSEITIKNIRHWNTLNRKWEPTSIQEQISLEKAVVLLNDKPLDRETFYLIKEKSKVYIIKSKNVSTMDDAYIVIIEQ